MSYFQDLKKAIQAFEANPSQELKSVDDAFEKIVVSQQSDLIKSLDLVEDFLVKALEDQKSLKKSA